MTEQEIQFVKELKSKYEGKETTTQKIQKLIEKMQDLLMKKEINLVNY